MAVDVEAFRVVEGEKVNLDVRPTLVPPIYTDKKDYKKQLKKHVERLRDVQEKLFAHDTFAVLLVFQAMDTAGKDGAIRHVMSGVNPQGTQVYSFKHPSSTELDHDFLWRTYECLPERGRIGIFNRSYYEEVLVVRVHPEILASQRLPNGITEDHAIWNKRYESIRDHEEHLHRNGTRIVKFFLHVSKEEQAKRLLSRIDDPSKNWKASPADIEERKFWDGYMEAYADCLSATSTKHAPWYVIPSDDKKNARLFVSQVVAELLASLKVDYPKVSPERLEELEQCRVDLLAQT
jgi:PPK2 family polyphosphate:nucleotide phosphotransferase